MRAARYGIIAFCCFAVLIAVFPGSTQLVGALAPDTDCSTLAQDALNAAKESCGSAGANSLCLGFENVQATFSDASTPTFKTRGDKVDLATVGSVTTSTVDPTAKSWGVAVLNLQAGLSEGSQGVSAVLFGDATLTSTVKPVGADQVTLPAISATGEPVLLRGGAGPNFPSLVTLNGNQNAVVDGRNKAGDWLRVRLDSAVGWAYVRQLKVTGDAKTLPVLDDSNSRADFLYQAAMQSFTLKTNTQTACGQAPSGLLLQFAGDQPVRLLVNGADVIFKSATLLLRATPKDRLEIAVINGATTVAAQGSSIDLNAGEWVRLRLGGADGLMVSAPAATKTKYTFAAIDYAPLGLLAQPVSCTVGLPANSKQNTDDQSVRVGPGKERGSLFFMKPDQSYAVNGWANDATGAPWWKITVDGNPQAWIAQSAVHAIGSCDQVATATVPPVIAAVPSGDDTSGGNTSTDAGNPGFAPAAKTIWDADPGQDHLTGTCSGVVLNYCKQLVAITPKGNGMLWKGQELTPYFLSRIRENVYAYSGPNALGDGQIKITLVFTSATAFKATHIITLSNEPSCQHNYTFTGVFLR